MNPVASSLLSTLLAAGCIAAVPAIRDDSGRALAFEDLMRFERIREASINDAGTWIAYARMPDRGDAVAVFREVDGASEHRVERGRAPRVTPNGSFGVARIEPSLEERVAADKDGKGSKDKPKPGLAVVALATGDAERIERVESFALSDDGRWLAYRRHASDEDEAEDAEGEAEAPEAEAPEEAAAEEGAGDEEPEPEPKEPELGTDLHLRELATGEERVIEHVRSFSFDDPSSTLIYAVSAPAGEGNGLFAARLGGDAPDAALHARGLAVYSHATWAEDRTRLAFIAADFDPEDGEPVRAEVWTWDGAGEARPLAADDDAPAGFALPAENRLAFSADGQRLFLGFAPRDEDEEPDEGDDEAPFDPYDVEEILSDRGVDVWHWNDPWINSNQKKRWEESEKDRVYLAVAHLDTGELVQLAGEDLPEIYALDAPAAVLGRSDVPYRREVTWDGTYADLYRIDLATGEPTLVSRRMQGRARLSPSGRFASFYRDGDWHLYDDRSGSTRNVTRELGVPFANEDHDYPSDPPGYGQGEWLDDDSAFLVYDKYDVWQVFTAARAPLRLTDGRDERVIHRVLDRDPDVDHLPPGAELLLSAYHDLEKHDTFVAGRLGEPGVRPIYGTGAHRLELVAQAEDSPRALVTRERYDEYPDLWVTDFESDPVRLSDADAQRDGIAWGSAELIEWRSLDGVPLQGVLIKPGNYVEGQRYPVLVYFYRFYSQRLNEFNDPVINHRPSFPLYASDGYAIFLPDVRFEVGSPGFSATKCLVPGIQELIDRGIADPDAIGLHGHSWSGYQAAFVITQTDAFAAAVAGAPVSNMTSAYGGLRYGTGLARQFQYEKSQSRIGASLWEARDLYIENSPVFFADRIETPLLIQFGDDDGAVPWTQGVELYLACRRLGKDCVFLQYRGEPHHLKRYANKLDYSIKMKEFFDHHLRGAPAPAWMTQGVPYRGE
ncbi:MAG: prolyl oligopeptidase family serine peptidase [Planctomycetota bacterium]